MSPQFVNGSDASIAKIRHEIRTPLNHIIGYSEILLEEEFSGPFEPLLRSIAAHSREMLSLVQKLLPSQIGSSENPREDAEDKSPVGREPGLKGLNARNAALRQLPGAVNPHVDQIEELLRKVRAEAPPNAVADLDRIEIAAKKLRAVISGAITEPALLVPDMQSRFGSDLNDEAANESDPERSRRHPGTAAAPGAILVVDDNELNRDMLSRQLIRQRYSVDTASGGEEAIEMLRKRRYDILLLDVLMPGMNGFEVLEKVKSDPALRTVAVIVVSALDEVDGAIRCIELGAEDYLFKPVNPTLLRARVRSTLDRMRTEEALRRRQRFESIGMLAAGVAHDFNNLLTGMIGNAHLLTQVLSDRADREMAESIVQAGERAAELTRQLLAYAGKGAFLVRPLELPGLIRDTERLIRASLPGKSELRLNLTAVPRINADANQIRQALLNLTINAAEALSSDPQDCITIETGVEIVSANARFDLGPEDLTPGEYVFLDVRDTGCGIHSEAMPQIFEPFYSTKFLGRGLGLAAVAGIVRSHSGMMRVTSAPGRGSAFRVYFPALSRAPVAVAESKLAVLVVDDEPVIRQIAKVAIERSGHKVYAAESGTEAVALFADPANRIGVVLLDLRMPQMDGNEVLQRLQTICPEIDIIVSSGLPQGEVESQLRGSRVSGILQKPYRMTELVRIIEGCLSKVKSS